MDSFFRISTISREDAKVPRGQELQAIRDSILHWQLAVEALYPRSVVIDGSQCALCTYSREVRDQYCASIGDTPEVISDLSICTFCPIARMTGMSGCHNTPHHGAWKALRRWQASPTDEDAQAAWQVCAHDEVEFLEEILLIELSRPETKFPQPPTNRPSKPPVAT